MIWIDLAHKLPTDKDIPEWTPWTQEQWNEWKAFSSRLVKVMAWLEKKGQRDRRNFLIDKYRDHWSKLKPWLQALSAQKCWFSEVRDLYSHYDVEHFRPKKEARSLDGTERDGYWWLAFDYMNFRLCGNVGNRKKGGWFPLKTGSPCSTYAQPCEESESCYLLDPINAGDVTLIAFDEEGKVSPTPDASEWDKERVRETVKRLKLNEHAPLAEERRKVWQQVNRLVNDFLAAKARSSGGNNPVAKEKLNEACSHLRKMLDPTAELSSVARWCLLLRNDRQLLKLLG